MSRREFLPTVRGSRSLEIHTSLNKISISRVCTYQRLTSAAAPISDVGWKTNNVLALAANHGDGFKFWQFDLTKPGQKELAASAVDSDRPLQFSVAQNGRLVAFSNY